MCVNILSAVIKRQTPCRLHTGYAGGTRGGEFLSPFYHKVSGWLRRFRNPNESVFTYCTKVCTTVRRNLWSRGAEWREEGEASENVPAMHHFIINSHVGIKMLTLSDLTD